MGVWVLSGFDRETEEPVLEVEVPGLTVELVREALGAPPDDPMLGEWPVPEEAAYAVSGAAPEPLDFTRVDYFLGECSSGPELERRDGAYLPPRDLPPAFGATTRAYPKSPADDRDAATNEG